MLFVAEDHLAKRDDLDIWDARLLIPEAAALGSQMALLANLGPRAEERLEELCPCTEAEAESGIFELLVGLACVRRGFEPEMLDERRKGTGDKTPDIRLHSFAAPTYVECKRKRALSGFAEAEARWMLQVFRRIRVRLGVNARLDVVLREPTAEIDQAAFYDAVTSAIEGPAEGDSTYSWGTLGIRRLPLISRFPGTRLYSPSFLEAVAGAPSPIDDCDGFICEVDAPSRPVVGVARNPLVLTWTHHAEVLPIPKVRGIGAPVGKGTLQIPDGDAGILYVAYEESSRTATADQRTERVLDELSKWTTPWHKNIAGVMVVRIFPRLFAEGRPDFVENTVLMPAQGWEGIFRKLPGDVFVPKL